MISVNRVERMKRQIDSALQSFEEPRPARAAEAGAPDIVAAPAPDLLSTATRLGVGSLLLAVDGLAVRAPAWEQLAQGEAVAGPAPGGAQSLSAPHHDAPADSLIMLAAIGWLAAIPEQLRADADPQNALETIRAQLAGTIGALARGALVMLSRGRLGPTTMLDDPDLRRWIAIGQVEARRSRTLASVAMLSVVRESVAYLASEPAVKQIVQGQGTTLAADVLGEVREYTVSGDTFVDGLVRRFFGRRARAGAPEDRSEVVGAPAAEEG